MAFISATTDPTIEYHEKKTIKEKIPDSSADIVEELSQLELELDKIVSNHPCLAFNVEVVKQQFQIMKNLVSLSETDLPHLESPANSSKKAADIRITPTQSQRSGNTPKLQNEV